MEHWELKQMQKLPLEIKILKSQQRIREWFEFFGGNVHVTYSGGKDSTVLLDLVRRIYPRVPALFVDTGLEYPEIKEHVRNTDNVIILRPLMSFPKVIKTYGYPVVSKKIARFIRDLQNPTNNNKATRNLRLTGYNQKGQYCPTMKVPKKWLPLVDAPFKVSEQCCDVMKKEPFNRYQKQTNSKPMTGVMACESNRRERDYLQTGCNAFNLRKPISMPLGFWTEQDILQYLKEFNIPYASVYGDIIQTEKGLITTGEKRTGCMFCMFGVHLEKGENRFQRMAKTHPKQYDYCINKLGCGKVLDYIGVKY